MDIFGNANEIQETEGVGRNNNSIGIPWIKKSKFKKIYTYLFAIKHLIKKIDSDVDNKQTKLNKYIPHSKYANRFVFFWCKTS